MAGRENTNSIPDLETRRSLEGTVWVCGGLEVESFDVSNKGSPEIRTTRGAGYGCDKAKVAVSLNDTIQERETFTVCGWRATVNTVLLQGTRM